MVKASGAEFVCYNRVDPLQGNKPLKIKSFILAQTRIAQSAVAGERARKWLLRGIMGGLFAVAAIAVAAQLHPDASQKSIRQALAVPVVLAEPPATPESEYWVEEKIVPRDTVVEVLARLGVRDEHLRRFIHADPGARPLYRLLPGKSVRARIDEDGELLALRYLTRDGEMLQIDQDTNGDYRARSGPPAVTTRLQVRSGEIRSSLFAAADAANLPDIVTMQLAEIFSGDIDFFHDLRRGDQFAVAYEVHELDGETIRVGRVVAAEFVNKGVAYRAFYDADAEAGQDTGGYYAEDGKSLRKAFLRSPMEFSRITSHFTLARFHPILQTWRAHKGIDFGAPTGTTVRATGDGAVEFAGRQGGYGNLVLLRHQGAYTTAYGHLSRFAAGLRRGTRIHQNQVIGYVGQTGWATGPHLHYEFRVNDVQRNPLSIALPTAVPITPQRLPSFRARSDTLSTQLGLTRGLTFAAAD